MALPDFVIIGAMKCGTTTLAAQLAAQKGAFLSTPKEPCFFSDDAVHARGLAWYEALFEGAGQGVRKGEASTHYAKLPTYPETVARMADALPAPRLVYMLRDPIERAVSHYIHEWSQGTVGGNPAAAFEAHPEIVAYGRYAMQIAPYLETFGREAILLTSLERLTADPGGELSRVAAHIGIAGPVAWRDDLGAQNVSAERVRKLPLHGLLVDNPLATALRRALVPKSLRTRIRQARTIGKRPELPEMLKTRLREIYAADLAELRRLVPGTELGFEDRYSAAGAA